MSYKKRSPLPLKIEEIDYMDIQLLRKFITETGKIIGTRTTAVHARVQRKLATAIKRARYIALIPYCDRH